jgi:signal transduction histidine kinase
LRESAAAILKQDLRGKIRWFITLRWLAAAGLALVITAARFLLDIPLPLVPLYLGNLFLLGYNGICHAVNRKLQRKIDTPDWIDKAHRLANIQILVDLSLLTYLIVFSGGLGNPFVFYYIFHMIISSILLTNRSAYLQATFASVLFGLLIAAELMDLLPYPPAFSPGAAAEAASIAGYLGRFLAFSSTLYISVYLTTTIVKALRQRERELEVSNRLLAEQDKAKSQYVLIVSHDIQSSLSAIESCLQTVLQGYTDPIGEKTRDMVQRANVRTRHLLRFVRDLLDISRMRTANEVAKERVNLVEVIEKEVDLFQQQSRDMGLHLSFENTVGQVILEANRFSMEQLFNNLLSNALRYTPEGGSVAVLLQAGSRKNVVEARISDSGIGIAPESLPHIFDDFYRAGNAKAFTENGTGLGLAIVKRIVELHNGEIRVESGVNVGTTFIFTLPTVQACPEAEVALH